MLTIIGVFVLIVGVIIWGYSYIELSDILDEYGSWYRFDDDLRQRVKDLNSIDKIGKILIGLGITLIILGFIIEAYKRVQQKNKNTPKIRNLVCLNCGNIINSAEKFCSECGEPINNHSSNQSTLQQQSLINYPEMHKLNNSKTYFYKNSTPPLKLVKKTNNASTGSLCRFCGAQRGGDSLFCAKCGNKIN